jgi:hypothetical protein
MLKGANQRVLMQIKQTQLHHTSSGSEESKWESRRGDHAEYATDIKAHNNLNLSGSCP